MNSGQQPFYPSPDYFNDYTYDDLDETENEEDVDGGEEGGASLDEDAAVQQRAAEIADSVGLMRNSPVARQFAEMELRAQDPVMAVRRAAQEFQTRLDSQAVESQFNQFIQRQSIRTAKANVGLFDSLDDQLKVQEQLFAYGAEQSRFQTGGFAGRSLLSDWQRIITQAESGSVSFFQFQQSDLLKLSAENSKFEVVTQPSRSAFQKFDETGQQILIGNELILETQRGIRADSIGSFHVKIGTFKLNDPKVKELAFIGSQNITPALTKNTTQDIIFTFRNLTQPTTKAEEQESAIAREIKQAQRLIKAEAMLSQKEGRPFIPFNFEEKLATLTQRSLFTGNEIRSKMVSALEAALNDQRRRVLLFAPSVDMLVSDRKNEVLDVLEKLSKRGQITVVINRRDVQKVTGGLLQRMAERKQVVQSGRSYIHNNALVVFDEQQRVLYMQEGSARLSEKALMPANTEAVDRLAVSEDVKTRLKRGTLNTELMLVMADTGFRKEMGAAGQNIREVQDLLESDRIRRASQFYQDAVFLSQQEPFLATRRGVDTEGILRLKQHLEELKSLGLNLDIQTIYDERLQSIKYLDVSMRTDEEGFYGANYKFTATREGIIELTSGRLITGSVFKNIGERTLLTPYTGRVSPGETVRLSAEQTAAGVVATTFRALQYQQTEMLSYEALRHSQRTTMGTIRPHPGFERYLMIQIERALKGVKDDAVPYRLRTLKQYVDYAIENVNITALKERLLQQMVGEDFEASTAISDVLDKLFDLQSWQEGRNIFEATRQFQNLTLFRESAIRQLRMDAMILDPQTYHFMRKAAQTQSREIKAAILAPFLQSHELSYGFHQAATRLPIYGESEPNIGLLNPLDVESSTLIGAPGEYIRLIGANVTGQKLRISTVGGLRSLKQADTEFRERVSTTFETEVIGRSIPGLGVLTRDKIAALREELEQELGKKVEFHPLEAQLKPEELYLLTSFAYGKTEQLVQRFKNLFGARPTFETSQQVWEQIYGFKKAGRLATGRVREGLPELQFEAFKRVYEDFLGEGLTPDVAFRRAKEEFIEREIETPYVGQRGVIGPERMKRVFIRAGMGFASDVGFKNVDMPSYAYSTQVLRIRFNTEQSDDPQQTALKLLDLLQPGTRFYTKPIDVTHLLEKRVQEIQQAFALKSLEELKGQERADVMDQVYEALRVQNPLAYAYDRKTNTIYRRVEDVQRYKFKDTKYGEVVSQFLQNVGVKTYQGLSSRQRQRLFEQLKRTARADNLEIIKVDESGFIAGKPATRADKFTQIEIGLDEPEVEPLLRRELKSRGAASLQNLGFKEYVEVLESVSRQLNEEYGGLQWEYRVDIDLANKKAGLQRIDRGVAKGVEFIRVKAETDKAYRRELLKVIKTRGIQVQADLGILASQLEQEGYEAFAKEGRIFLREGMYVADESKELGFRFVSGYDTKGNVNLVEIKRQTRRGEEIETIKIRPPAFSRRFQEGVSIITEAPAIHFGENKIVQIEVPIATLRKDASSMRLVSTGSAIKSPQVLVSGEFFQRVDPGTTEYSLHGDAGYSAVTFGQFKGFQFAKGAAMLTNERVREALRQTPPQRLARALGLLFGLTDDALTAAVGLKDYSQTPLAVGAFGLHYLAGAEIKSLANLDDVKAVVQRALQGDVAAQQTLSEGWQRLIDKSLDAKRSIGGRVVNISDPIVRSASLVASLIHYQRQLESPKYSGEFQQMRFFSEDAPQEFIERYRQSAMQSTSFSQRVDLVASYYGFEKPDLNKDEEVQAYLQALQTRVDHQIIFEEFDDVTQSASLVPTGTKEDIPAEFQYLLGLSSRDMQVFRGHEALGAKVKKAARLYNMILTSGYSGLPVTLDGSPKLHTIHLTEQGLSREWRTAWMAAAYGTQLGDDRFSLEETVRMHDFIKRHLPDQQVSIDARAQLVAKVGYEQGRFLYASPTVDSRQAEDLLAYGLKVEEGRSVFGHLVETYRQALHAWRKSGDSDFVSYVRRYTPLSAFDQQFHLSQKIVEQNFDVQATFEQINRSTLAIMRSEMVQDPEAQIFNRTLSLALQIEGDYRTGTIRDRFGVSQKEFFRYIRKSQQIVLPELKPYELDDGRFILKADPKGRDMLGIVLGADVMEAAPMLFAGYHHQALQNQREFVELLLEFTEKDPRTGLSALERIQKGLPVGIDVLQRYEELRQAASASLAAFESLASTSVSKKSFGERSTFEGGVGVITSNFGLDSNKVVVGGRYQDKNLELFHTLNRELNRAFSPYEVERRHAREYLTQMGILEEDDFLWADEQKGKRDRTRAKQTLFYKMHTEVLGIEPKIQVPKPKGGPGGQSPPPSPPQGPQGPQKPQGPQGPQQPPSPVAPQPPAPSAGPASPPSPPQPELRRPNPPAQKPQPQTKQKKRKFPQVEDPWLSDTSETPTIQSKYAYPPIEQRLDAEISSRVSQQEQVYPQEQVQPREVDVAEQRLPRPPTVEQPVAEILEQTQPLPEVRAATQPQQTPLRVQEQLYRKPQASFQSLEPLSEKDKAELEKIKQQLLAQQKKAKTEPTEGGGAYTIYSIYNPPEVRASAEERHPELEKLEKKYLKRWQQFFESQERQIKRQEERFAQQWQTLEAQEAARREKLRQKFPEPDVPSNQSLRVNLEQFSAELNQRLTDIDQEILQQRGSLIAAQAEQRRKLEQEINLAWRSNAEKKRPRRFDTLGRDLQKQRNQLEQQLREEFLQFEHSSLQRQVEAVRQIFGEETAQRLQTYGESHIELLSKKLIEQQKRRQTHEAELVDWRQRNAESKRPWKLETVERRLEEKRQKLEQELLGELETLQQEYRIHRAEAIFVEQDVAPPEVPDEKRQRAIERLEQQIQARAEKLKVKQEQQRQALQQRLEQRRQEIRQAYEAERAQILSAIEGAKATTEEVAETPQPSLRSEAQPKPLELGQPPQPIEFPQPSIRPEPELLEKEQESLRLGLNIETEPGMPLARIEQTIPEAEIIEIAEEQKPEQTLRPPEVIDVIDTRLSEETPGVRPISEEIPGIQIEEPFEEPPKQKQGFSIGDVVNRAKRFLDKVQNIWEQVKPSNLPEDIRQEMEDLTQKLTEERQAFAEQLKQETEQIRSSAKETKDQIHQEMRDLSQQLIEEQKAYREQFKQAGEEMRAAAQEAKEQIRQETQGIQEIRLQIHQEVEQILKDFDEFLHPWKTNPEIREQYIGAIEEIESLQAYAKNLRQEIKRVEEEAYYRLERITLEHGRPMREVIDPKITRKVILDIINETMREWKHGYRQARREAQQVTSDAYKQIFASQFQRLSDFVSYGWLVHERATEPIRQWMSEQIKEGIERDAQARDWLWQQLKPIINQQIDAGWKRQEAFARWLADLVNQNIVQPGWERDKQAKQQLWNWLVNKGKEIYEQGKERERQAKQQLWSWIRQEFRKGREREKEAARQVWNWVREAAAREYQRGLERDRRGRQAFAGWSQQQWQNFQAWVRKEAQEGWPRHQQAMADLRANMGRAAEQIRQKMAEGGQQAQQFAQVSREFTVSQLRQGWRVVQREAPKVGRRAQELTQRGVERILDIGQRVGQTVKQAAQSAAHQAAREIEKGLERDRRARSAAAAKAEETIRNIQENLQPDSPLRQTIDEVIEKTKARVEQGTEQIKTQISQGMAAIQSQIKEGWERDTQAKAAAAEWITLQGQRLQHQVSELSIQVQETAKQTGERVRQAATGAQQTIRRGWQQGKRARAAAESAMRRADAFFSQQAQKTTEAVREFNRRVQETISQGLQRDAAARAELAQQMRQAAEATQEQIRQGLSALQQTGAAMQSKGEQLQEDIKRVIEQTKTSIQQGIFAAQQKMEAGMTVAQQLYQEGLQRDAQARSAAAEAIRSGAQVVSERVRRGVQETSSALRQARRQARRMGAAIQRRADRFFEQVGEQIQQGLERDQQARAAAAEQIQNVGEQLQAKAQQGLENLQSGLQQIQQTVSSQIQAGLERDRQARQRFSSNIRESMAASYQAVGNLFQQTRQGVQRGVENLRETAAIRWQEVQAQSREVGRRTIDFVKEQIQAGLERDAQARAALKQQIQSMVQHTQEQIRNLQEKGETLAQQTTSAFSEMYRAGLERDAAAKAALQSQAQAMKERAHQAIQNIRSTIQEGMERDRAARENLKQQIQQSIQRAAEAVQSGAQQTRSILSEQTRNFIEQARAAYEAAEQAKAAAREKLREARRAAKEAIDAGLERDRRARQAAQEAVVNTFKGIKRQVENLGEFTLEVGQRTAEGFRRGVEQMQAGIRRAASRKQQLEDRAQAFFERIKERTQQGWEADRQAKEQFKQQISEVIQQGLQRDAEARSQLAQQTQRIVRQVQEVQKTALQQAVELFDQTVMTGQRTIQVAGEKMRVASRRARQVRSELLKNVGEQLQTSAQQAMAVIRQIQQTAEQTAQTTVAQVQSTIENLSEQGRRVSSQIYENVSQQFQAGLRRDAAAREAVAQTFRDTIARGQQVSEGISRQINRQWQEGWRRHHAAFVRLEEIKPKEQIVRQIQAIERQAERLRTGADQLYEQALTKGSNVIEDLKRKAESLSQQIQQGLETLRAQGQAARQAIEQTIEPLREQGQRFKDDTKERLDEIAQNLQQKISQGVQSLQEKTQDLSAQVQNLGQQTVENLQREVPKWRDTVNETIRRTQGQVSRAVEGAKDRAKRGRESLRRKGQEVQSALEAKGAEIRQEIKQVQAQVSALIQQGWQRDAAAKEQLGSFLQQQGERVSKGAEAARQIVRWVQRRIETGWQQDAEAKTKAAELVQRLRVEAQEKTEQFKLQFQEGIRRDAQARAEAAAAMRESAAQALNIARRVGEASAEALRERGQQLQLRVEQSYRTLRRLYQQGRQRDQQAKQALADNLQNARDAISQQISQVAHRVEMGSAVVQQRLADLRQSANEGYRILREAYDAGVQRDAQARSQLGEVISEAGRQTQTTLSDIKQRGSQWIENIRQAGGEAISRAIRTGQERDQQARTVVNQWLYQGARETQQIIQSITAASKEAAREAATSIRATGERLQTQVEKGKDALRRTRQTLEDISARVARGVEQFEQRARQAIDAGQQRDRQAKEKLQEGIQIISDLFRTTTQDAIQTVRTGAEGIKQRARNVQEQVQSRLEEINERIQQATAAGWQRDRQARRQAAQGARRAARNIRTGIQQVQDTIGRVYQERTEVDRQARQAAAEGIRSAAAQGREIVQSLFARGRQTGEAIARWMQQTSETLQSKFNEQIERGWQRDVQARDKAAEFIQRMQMEAEAIGEAFKLQVEEGWRRDAAAKSQLEERIAAIQEQVREGNARLREQISEAKRTIQQQWQAGWQRDTAAKEQLRQTLQDWMQQGQQQVSDFREQLGILRETIREEIETGWQRHRQAWNQLHETLRRTQENLGHRIRQGWGRDAAARDRLFSSLKQVASRIRPQMGRIQERINRFQESLKEKRGFIQEWLRQTQEDLQEKQGALAEQLERFKETVAEPIFKLRTSGEGLIRQLVPVRDRDLHAKVKLEMFKRFGDLYRKQQDQTSQELARTPINETVRENTERTNQELDRLANVDELTNRFKQDDKTRTSSERRWQVDYRIGQNIGEVFQSRFKSFIDRFIRERPLRSEDLRRRVLDFGRELYEIARRQPRKVEQWLRQVLPQPAAGERKEDLRSRINRWIDQQLSRLMQPSQPIDRLKDQFQEIRRSLMSVHHELGRSIQEFLESGALQRRTSETSVSQGGRIPPRRPTEPIQEEGEQGRRRRQQTQPTADVSTGYTPETVYYTEPLIADPWLDKPEGEILALPPWRQRLLPPARQEALPAAEQKLLPPGEQLALPQGKQKLLPPGKQLALPEGEQKLLPPGEQLALPEAEQKLLPPSDTPTKTRRRRRTDKEEVSEKPKRRSKRKETSEKLLPEGKLQPIEIPQEPQPSQPMKITPEIEPEEQTLKSRQQELTQWTEADREALWREVERSQEISREAKELSERARRLAEVNEYLSSPMRNVEQEIDKFILNAHEINRSIRQQIENAAEIQRRNEEAANRWRVSREPSAKPTQSKQPQQPQQPAVQAPQLPEQPTVQPVQGTTPLESEQKPQLLLPPASDLPTVHGTIQPPSPPIITPPPTSGKEGAPPPPPPPRRKDLSQEILERYRMGSYLVHRAGHPPGSTAQLNAEMVFEGASLEDLEDTSLNRAIVASETLLIVPATSRLLSQLGDDDGDMFQLLRSVRYRLDEDVKALDKEYELVLREAKALDQSYRQAIEKLSSGAGDTQQLQNDLNEIVQRRAKTRAKLDDLQQRRLSAVQNQEEFRKRLPQLRFADDLTGVAQWSKQLMGIPEFVNLDTEAALKLVQQQEDIISGFANFKKPAQFIRRLEKAAIALTEGGDISIFSGQELATAQQIIQQQNLTTRQDIQTYFSKELARVSAVSDLNKHLSKAVGIDLTSSELDVVQSSIGEVGTKLIGQTYNAFISIFEQQTWLGGMITALSDDRIRGILQQELSSIAQARGVEPEVVNRLLDIQQYQKAYEMRRQFLTRVNQMIRDSLKAKSEGGLLEEIVKSGVIGQLEAASTEEERLRILDEFVNTSLGPSLHREAGAPFSLGMGLSVLYRRDDTRLTGFGALLKAARAMGLDSSNAKLLEDFVHSDPTLASQFQDYVHRARALDIQGQVSIEKFVYETISDLLVRTQSEYVVPRLLEQKETIFAQTQKWAAGFEAKYRGRLDTLVQEYEALLAFQEEISKINKVSMISSDYKQDLKTRYQHYKAVEESFKRNLGDISLQEFELYYLQKHAKPTDLESYIRAYADLTIGAQEFIRPEEIERLAKGFQLQRILSSKNYDDPYGLMEMMQEHMGVMFQTLRRKGDQLTAAEHIDLFRTILDRFRQIDEDLTTNKTNAQFIRGLVQENLGAALGDEAGLLAEAFTRGITLDPETLRDIGAMGVGTLFSDRMSLADVLMLKSSSVLHQLAILTQRQDAFEAAMETEDPLMKQTLLALAQQADQQLANREGAYLAEMQAEIAQALAERQGVAARRRKMLKRRQKMAKAGLAPLKLEDRIRLIEQELKARQATIRPEEQKRLLRQLGYLKRKQADAQRKIIVGGASQQGGAPSSPVPPVSSKNVLNQTFNPSSQVPPEDPADYTSAVQEQEAAAARSLDNLGADLKNLHLEENFERSQRLIQFFDERITPKQRAMGSILDLIGAPLIMAALDSGFQDRLGDRVGMLAYDIFQSIPTSLANAAASETAQRVSLMYTAERLKNAMRNEGLVVGAMRGFTQEIFLRSLTGVQRIQRDIFRSVFGVKRSYNPEGGNSVAAVASEILQNVAALSLARTTAKQNYPGTDIEAESFQTRILMSISEQIWQAAEAAMLDITETNFEIIDTEDNENLDFIAVLEPSPLQADLESGMVVLDENEEAIKREFDHSEQEWVESVRAFNVGDNRQSWL